MSPETYWPALSVIGKLSPSDEELSGAAALIARLDPAALFDEIVRSRVYTLALRNLSLLPEEGNVATVVASLRDLEKEETARRELALPENRALLKLVHDLGDGARVIKGLALREHYPDPELRHIGDLDLHVPDWSRAQHIAVTLRERGWQWDTQEFPWIKWTDGGSVYGQLTLVLPDNQAPHSRVDLHIGPFSVGHSALMPLVGWRSREVLGVPATVPCPESELALIAAHAVNDGLLSMKDVNDVLVLLSRHPYLDLGSVEELCRAAGAIDAMRDILTTVTRVYGDDVTPAPAWLLPHRAELSYLTPGKETVSGRGERVRRLTLQDEQARGRAHNAAERLANEAYDYFTGALAPRLGEPDIPGPTEPYQRRDLCWRLLPEESWRKLAEQAPDSKVSCSVTELRLADGIRLVRTQKGAAIQAGNEVFVPTVWGPVDPESTALARRLAGDRT